MGPKTKTKEKASKSSKKTEIDTTKPNAIQEKPYITKDIETSITLLGSPENDLVLESLLFLSKYADIQRNNLIYVQSRGLLPKLLALLDHNICIVRVSLRLLSQLLTVEAAQVELNQEKFDETVMKICKFYISHSDVNVKEFSIRILATYCTLGRSQVLLQVPDFVACILKTIKSPENDVILNSSLELFRTLIELETVRKSLPEEKDFNLEIFVEQMQKSEDCFRTILAIFEKMTYFGEDVLQEKLKECNIVEHVFSIIIDPNRSDYISTCLNIITHCMRNAKTSSYFVTSLEFLKFAHWVKTCPEEAMPACSSIFLELSRIDSIRQMLFDLSIEDIILSFLRSCDKKVLNTTCDAISFMSKHKYCCEKMVTPIVIKKLLEIMQGAGDGDDPNNKIALSTLHYFCRRDSRTIHMIRTYDGMKLILQYLKEGIGKLTEHSYKKVLEMVNMFVTNNQLREVILSTDLYEVILTQSSSEFDEICMRSLEIMINCLSHKDFQNYFLLNKGSRVVADKITATRNEQVVRLLIIFIHKALMYDSVAKDLVRNKILLILKKIPDGTKYRNPLIERVTNLIYNMCLPVKFFETGRLELTDKLNEKFYIITGIWNEPFPFLEILQMRQVSTLNTIYVVDGSACREPGLTLQLQQSTTDQHSSISSISSSNSRTSHDIKFGKLTPDQYFPKYVEQVINILSNVTDFNQKVKTLAQFVDRCLCGPEEDASIPDKLHTFKLHLQCIKQKLGTNMIPIGYLRLGFQCERALLFKALADRVYLPATLVRGRKNNSYWNEIGLIQTVQNRTCLRMFVVDLMNNIGQLLPVGSRESSVYCDIE